MKLAEFIEAWNTKQIDLEDFNQSNLAWLESCTSRDFEDTYGTQKERLLSISQLYKPLGFLYLDKLGIKNQQVQTGQSRYHLMTGKMWENIILSWMYQLGVDIHSLQKTVQYKGLDGHIDCIYSDNRVIDIKTMSPYYYKSFVESPDDDRGYITQILCYQEALNVEYASILALNKISGELSLVNIDREQSYVKGDNLCTGQEFLDRATKVIELYSHTPSIESIVYNYLLPINQSDLIQTRYGEKPPYAVQYDSRRHALWEFDNKYCIKKKYLVDEVLNNLEDLYDSIK